MKEAIKKLRNYQWNKGASLRERAWRILADFLIFILIFTFLSRSADSLTIAQVQTETISDRVIEHRVEASGKVEENEEQALNIEPGIRIKSVHVKDGDRVKKGDVLIELDSEHLEELILEKKKEIKELELTNEALDSTKQAEKTSQDTAKNRALEDYQIAKKDGDAAVKGAKADWEAAKKALSDYKKTSQKTKNTTQSKEAQELKEARIQADAAKKQAETIEKQLDTLAKQLEAMRKQRFALENEREEKIRQELGRKRQELSRELTESEQSEIEEMVKKQYQIQIDNVAQKEEAAEKERTALEKEERKIKRAKKAADKVLEEAKTAGQEVNTAQNANEEESQLRAAVKETKTAYDEALKNRSSSLLSAKRALEDAGAPKGEDKTDEINDLKIDTANLELKKLTSLKKAEGKVKSPTKGVITGLSAVTGSKTTEEAAVLLADLSSGVRFTAQVSKEQEKYLSVGAKVSLAPDGNNTVLDDLAVESVTTNQEDDSLLNVSVLLKKGELSIGQTAVMTVSQKSVQYPATISLSAIREEDGKNYVLVMRQKDTVLGTEWFAERVDVTIKEKNELYAALAEGALDDEDQVILASNKSIKAGDRVRQAEQETVQ